MPSDHARRSAPDAKAWAATLSVARPPLPPADASSLTSPALADRPIRAVRRRIAATRPIHTDARNWRGLFRARYAASCFRFSAVRLFAQRFASWLGERRIRKFPDQPNEQPMPVHRRMPIVAAAKSRRQFPRRRHISIAVQDMADLVRIFLFRRRPAPACANRSAAAESKVGAGVSVAASIGATSRRAQRKIFISLFMADPQS